MNLPKGVIFDLDNTLYDYEPCNRAGQVALFQFLQLPLDLSLIQLERAFNQARTVVHKRLNGQAAAHSRLLYIQTMVEQQTGQINPALVLQAEHIFWRAYLAAMQLRPGVRNILRDLRRQSVQLAIASDLTSAIQFHKLRRLRLASAFDVIVTSEEVGHEKPHPAVVQLTLRKLRLSAKQVVLVGDSMERDQMAAQQAGLPFFRLANDADVQLVRRYFDL